LCRIPRCCTDLPTSTPAVRTRSARSAILEIVHIPSLCVSFTRPLSVVEGASLRLILPETTEKTEETENTERRTRTTEKTEETENPERRTRTTEKTEETENPYRRTRTTEKTEETENLERRTRTTEKTEETENPERRTRTTEKTEETENPERRTRRKDAIAIDFCVIDGEIDAEAQPFDGGCPSTSLRCRGAWTQWWQSLSNRVRNSGKETIASCPICVPMSIVRDVANARGISNAGRYMYKYFLAL
jgi:hypothetical protein